MDKKTEYGQMIKNLAGETLRCTNYTDDTNTLEDLYHDAVMIGIKEAKDPVYDIEAYKAGRAFIAKRCNNRFASQSHTLAACSAKFADDHPIRLDMTDIYNKAEEEKESVDDDLQRCDLLAITLHVYNELFAEENKS